MNRDIIGREVVLDTETTGLYTEKNGESHYIIEIGAIEIVNFVPTGSFYHSFVKPPREVPKESMDIHGITTESLKDSPNFLQVVDEFLEFIYDSPLVIHNAPFDIRFINKELQRINYPLLSKNKIVDTLALAKEKFPGQRVNLDALCRMFNIDLSKRIKHSALLDAQLLSEVYVNLKGGKQTSIEFQERNHVIDKQEIKFPKNRSFPFNKDENNNHETFLKSFSLKSF